jgi:hypothetical protein
MFEKFKAKIKKWFKPPEDYFPRMDAPDTDANTARELAAKEDKKKCWFSFTFKF